MLYLSITRIPLSSLAVLKDTQISKKKKAHIVINKAPVIFYSL